MAEQRHTVVAHCKTIEEVGRLRIVGGDASPLELLDEDRPDGGEVEETGDVEAHRRAIGCYPDAVGTLGEALALQDRVTLGRVVFERVVLLEETLARVVEDLRARVLGNRQRRGTGGASPAKVHNLIAIDIRADRPAHIRISRRTASGVDVQRMWPPVLIAEWRLPP